MLKILILPFKRFSNKIELNLIGAECNKRFEKKSAKRLKINKKGGYCSSKADAHRCVRTSQAVPKEPMRVSPEVRWVNGTADRRQKGERAVARNLCTRGRVGGSSAVGATTV